jgi:hypothetical protein
MFERAPMSEFHPRLLEAETPAARMDALCAFIQFWLGPRRESYGESAEAVGRRPLPLPLRRLYQFAGRWPAKDDDATIEFSVPALSHQDTLIPLDKLRTTDDGKLVFLEENQAVWECNTLPEGDDPPVWCDGDIVSPDDGWFTGEKQVCGSLSRFLVTFVLQELTFGSRVHLRDTNLEARYRSEMDRATLLWREGPYVNGNHHTFHLWGHVLVASHYGDLVFAANHPEGIAFLTANQGPVRMLQVHMEPSWDLELRPDGSARLRQGINQAEESIQVPAGTFDFPGLFEPLRAAASGEGHYERNPTFFVFREGQSGGARGQHFHDEELVKSLFRLALAGAVGRNPALEGRFASRWPA